MNKDEYIFYDWDELQFDIGELEKKLRLLNFTFKNIYGIPRGGLVIAVMLSHRLGIPLVMAKSKISDDTLIVDDISDTGKTLKKFIKRNNTVATLWVSPRTKTMPTVFCKVVPDNKWIVFPFETLASTK